MVHRMTVDNAMQGHSEDRPGFLFLSGWQYIQATVLYYTILYYTILYYTILYYTTLYYILYYTIL